MKATGIVRRIDDLGRIVIPKEVRRHMKIREGDPMEIFVTEDGGVMLKKYSPVAKLTDFALEYASSLYETTDHITFITDRESVVAVAGGSRREYLNKAIGYSVYNCMDSRRGMLVPTRQDVQMFDGSNELSISCVISPIVVDGESIGSVIMMNKDINISMGVMETKLADTAASFLAKQMLNFE